MTCWNHHCTGGGPNVDGSSTSTGRIQYSTSRVELDFLVICAMDFV